MIDRFSRHRVALWTVGPLLLLGLNLARDLTHMQKKFEWEKVDVQTLHRGVATAGVMEAVRVSEIKSEVDELVLEKMAQEGQPVHLGQPLLRLSRSRTELEFEQRKNAYMSAESDYRKAVREVAVQKKLLRNLAVSRQQVEDTEQTLEKVKASLKITSQELEMAQKKLDSTLVRSTMEGVVLKDFTKVGMAVSPGKDIITVGDVSKFIVRAKVDELDIQQISVGQPVEVVADAFPGKMMKGKVSSIASQAEREAFAKVEVLIDITDAGNLTLKHNLSVRVNIVTENIANALSVPIRCVVKKEGETGWIITRNRLRFITTRRIKLGKTAGERIQVLDGLKQGDEIGTERPPDKSA